MPRRSLSELFRLNLDRAAIPIDEDGEQIFSELNPGHIADLVARAILAEIAEEVEEIEEHIHNEELWWGAAAAPTQDNAIEDNTQRPFTVVSGNDTWGPAIPVIGRFDNPVKPWQTHFDMHRVVISDVDNGLNWKLRFLFGNESALEAINALRITETMTIPSGIGANVGAGPSDLRMRIIPVGWNVWAQCRNFTNLDTMSFFVGVHGYPVRSM